MSITTTFPDIPLPSAIRSRFVDGINGLRMHVLEAGFETSGRPCLLLLHGFPELAYSWRKVMPDLAQAGYHVIAPDQRGYGRTTGWSADYDGDLSPFRTSAVYLTTLHACATLYLLSHLVEATVVRRLLCKCKDLDCYLRYTSLYILEDRHRVRPG